MNASDEKPTAPEASPEQLELLRGIHRQLRRIAFWLATLVVVGGAIGLYFVLRESGYGRLVFNLSLTAGGIFLLFSILGAAFRQKLERITPISPRIPSPQTSLDK